MKTESKLYFASHIYAANTRDNTLEDFLLLKTSFKVFFHKTYQ